MDYDFTNVHIKQKELRLLRRLKRNRKLKVIGTSFDFLYSNSLARPIYNGQDYIGCPIRSGYCEISERGIRYLIYRRNEFMRFLNRSVLIPIIVAIITAFITALITSRLFPTNTP